MTKLIYWVLLVIPSISFSQGVSFSYLIPTNGEIAAPISPFSIRGIGIGEVIGVETGASLYFIPGLPAKDLPFTTKKSIFGPQYTVLVPLQLFIKLPLGPATMKLTGGAFTWYNIASKINSGNMDNALKEYVGWEILNSDFNFKNQIGFGLIGGIELEFKINKSTALSFQTQYLSGTTKTALTGSYAGGNLGSNITMVQSNFPQAKASLEGFEISIGVSLLK